MSADTPASPSDFDSFLQDLGVPDANKGLLDETPPEPVDDEKLAAFRRNDLPEPESEWVAFLISRYREWHDADIRLNQQQRGTDGSEL